MTLGAALARARVAYLAQVETGFNKISRGGLQAYRVPIENFAGLLDCGPHSGGVAPLQLVVDAVRATNDHSVFGSNLMHRLLDFKWYGFARRAFLQELCWALLHTIVVAIYNLRTSTFIHLTLRQVTGLEDGYTPDYVILFGWSWTSLMCMRQLYTEIGQVRATGLLAYVVDFYNWFDWLYIVGQGVVNVLTVARDHVDDAYIVQYNVTRRRSLLVGDEAIDALGAMGEGLDNSGDWHGGWGGLEGHALHEHGHGHGGELPALGSLRRLRAGKAGTSDADVAGETFAVPGTMIFLQSLVVLVATLRLLYFFRGSLRLGALTHTIHRIFIDIMPLMVRRQRLEASGSSLASRPYILGRASRQLEHTHTHTNACLFGCFASTGPPLGIRLRLHRRDAAARDARA